MTDARLGFSNAKLLAKVVQMLDDIPKDDRDTKGDAYEYMLGKIASAGTNGQFRTPRHIIELMVNIMKPQPGDTICDPAAGICGILVAAGEYLRDHHPEMLRKTGNPRPFPERHVPRLRLRRHHAADRRDEHDLERGRHADVSYRGNLAEERGTDAGDYPLILANPPFAGSLDYDTTA